MKVSYEKVEEIRDILISEYDPKIYGESALRIFRKVVQAIEDPEDPWIALNLVQSKLEFWKVGRPVQNKGAAVVQLMFEKMFPADKSEIKACHTMWEAIIMEYVGRGTL